MNSSAGLNRRPWAALLATLAIASIALAPGPSGSLLCGTALAADKAPTSHTINSAWAFYQQKRFVESVDAFESLIKGQRPAARLYYHATLANIAAKRKARARQLATYIVNHFTSSTEASYSIRLFPELKAVVEAKKAAQKAAQKAKTAKAETKKEPESSEEELNVANLPEDFWRSLPAHVRRHLKTPAGKETLKGALRDYNKRQNAKKGKVATITGVKSKKKSSKKKREFKVEGDFRIGQPVFSAEDIAKDGAGGIDQSVNPNCWFEASMAALAELPRGRRLLASMIRYGGPDTYVVRFPRDGVEYKISEAEMSRRGIKDKSLWASLIECAQVMKFPNNRGAEGESGQESRLSVGLGCITGCKAQLMHPRAASQQELSSFIGGAVSSKNPIVCGTWPSSYFSGHPLLVVPTHAYTIIGFDAASKMITIRNPHGKHSRRFYTGRSSGPKKFVSGEDGVFKMHLSLFPIYFSQVCRSFI